MTKLNEALEQENERVKMNEEENIVQISKFKKQYQELTLKNIKCNTQIEQMKMTIHVRR